MEMSQGTLPLAILAIIFTGLQVWWIGTTIRNHKATKNDISPKNETTSRKKNELKSQKERLEDLFKR